MLAGLIRSVFARRRLERSQRPLTHELFLAHEDAGVEQGIAAYNAGQLDLALTALTRGAASRPRDAALLALLGMCLAERGEADRAQARFAEARSLDAGVGMRFAEAGNEAKRAGRRKRARGAYLVAERLLPGQTTLMSGRLGASP